MPSAIFNLYYSLQTNPQIGGVCGEIAVRNPRLYNLIEASQHFEYKVSHVMDKGECGGGTRVCACARGADGAGNGAHVNADG